MRLSRFTVTVDTEASPEIALQTGRGSHADPRRDQGRLATEDLRRLFQEVHHMEQKQGQLDVDSLAKR